MESIFDCMKISANIAQNTNCFVVLCDQGIFGKYGCKINVFILRLWKKNLYL